MTFSDVESLASFWYLTNPDELEGNLLENYYLRRHDYSSTLAQDAFKAMYSSLYHAVLETNMIIQAFRDGKGSVILDDQSRAVVEGEAYALRAFLHFDILRLFGQMPTGGTKTVNLAYSEVTSIDDKLVFCSFEEYVEKLKNDIEQAKSLLKDNDPICRYTFADLANTNSSGYDEVSLKDDFMVHRQYRMNYWAVRALEARMYLYLGDKTRAHDVALEVINATTPDGQKVIELSSVDDYGAENSTSYASPSESLFSLYYDDLYSITVKPLWGQPTKEAGGDVRDVDEYLYLDKELQPDLFVGCDANDIRSKKMWVLTKDTQNGQVYTTTKYYKDEDSPSGIIPLLRMSEMYLIAIEGAYSLTEANALYYTYMVSKDVSRPDYFKSEGELQVELEKEFRREFVAEGQLFYFYKRNNVKKHWSNESQTIDESHYVIPLPNTEY